MSENQKLEVVISGIKMRNPLILASGILGVVPSTMVRLAGRVSERDLEINRSGPRKGYGNPSVVELSKGTLLNSVGLADPGIDEFVKEIEEYKSRTDVRLFVSVFGGDPDVYANIAGQC